MKNKDLSYLSKKTKNFLKLFREKYSKNDILSYFKRFENLKILLIGDAIIDEYYYCESMGRSSKDPIIANRYLYHEEFAGGVFAVANNLAEICKNVKLITVLGEKDKRDNFILSHLNNKIKRRFFYRKDAHTIIKRRYINEYFNQKLFEVCYIKNEKIDENLERKILKTLKKEINEFDLVMVSDFGHGLITNNIIEFLKENSKVLAVNVQTNSDNLGFNFVTKYGKVNFACIDEQEARLASQDRYLDIKGVIKKISEKLYFDFLIVTRGSRGSIGYSKDKSFTVTPALAGKIVDRIGSDCL